MWRLIGLLALLLKLIGVSLVQAQPAFQVFVTPSDTVDIAPGGTATLTASASYPAFAVGAGFNGTVRAIVIQADGKILVGGSFSSYKGVARTGIARLYQNGDLDTSFGSPGFNGTVNAIVVQPDDRVVVAGSFTRYGTNYCGYIARLNSDGSFDTSFTTGAGFNNTVNAIARQPDGKIVAGGSFTSYNGSTLSTCYYIARLNSDGTRDTGFNPLTAGSVRFDAPIKTLAIQTDGRILIGGAFTSYINNVTGVPSSRYGISRLLSTGEHDSSYTPAIPSGQGNPSVEVITLIPSGSAMVGGNNLNFSGAALVQLTSSGSLGSFSCPSAFNDVNVAVLAIAIQGTNILAGGLFRFNNILYRLSATGTADVGYAGVLITSSSSIYAIATQSDGKVLAGGDFVVSAGSSFSRIIRLTAGNAAAGGGSVDNTSTPISNTSYTWSPTLTGNTESGAFNQTLTARVGGTYTASTTIGSGSSALTGRSRPVVVRIAPNKIVDPIGGSPLSATPIRGGVYNTLTINPGGIGKLTGDITILDSAMVQAGGTLRLGPWRVLSVTSTSKFRVGAGSTLSTGHPAGIALAPDTSGAVKTARRVYKPDASYIYTAAATPVASAAAAVQFTGSGLPTQVRNLTDSTGVARLTTGTGTPPIVLKLTARTSVSRVLTMASAAGGDFDLNNQRLVLLSDNAGTALVVNNPGSGVVRGKATMQRYLRPVPNAGMGYRYYSSPVAGMIVDSLRTATFTPVVNAPSANVFFYDQSRPAVGAPFESGLTTPASLSSQLAVGKGYAINVAATEELRFAGTLTTGTQAVSTLTRDAPANASMPDNKGWNLVGNPYPAPIDWSLMNPATDLANVGAAIYVYESTGPNAGVYVPYVSGVGRNPVLAAGQSFFVRVHKGKTTGSLTFRDAQRVSSYDTVATFNRQPAPDQVALALVNRNGGSSTSRPPVVVHHNLNATPGAGFSPLTDAYFIPNQTGTSAQALSVSVSSADPNDELSIKGVPSFDNTVIPLTVRASGAGSYRLVANVRVPSGVRVFLDDDSRRFRGSVNLGAQDTMNITLTAQEALQSTGRFALRFVKTPLPVELTDFAVARRGPAAHLTWATASERNSLAFEVERSRDGNTFERIGSVAAAGNSGARTYSFDDAALPRSAAPVVYYRLRQVDTDGSAYYSAVRTLALADLSGALPRLTAYPQPARGQLHVLGAAPGTVLGLDDLLGRRVFTAATPVADSGETSLLLPNLPAGTYLLRGGHQTLRLVLQ